MCCRGLPSVDYIKPGSDSLRHEHNAGCASPRRADDGTVRAANPSCECSGQCGGGTGDDVVPTRMGFGQHDGAANGSQPFSSEDKTNVIGGWLPSLTFAVGPSHSRMFERLKQRFHKETWQETLHWLGKGIVSPRGQAGTTPGGTRRRGGNPSGEGNPKSWI